MITFPFSKNSKFEFFSTNFFNFLSAILDLIWIQIYNYKILLSDMSKTK
jgi:hypothetical protein